MDTLDQVGGLIAMIPALLFVLALLGLPFWLIYEARETPSEREQKQWRQDMAVQARYGGNGTESPLEVAFLERVRAAGLAEPELQYAVVTHKRVYRLDFAYTGIRLAIETDGSHHLEAHQLEYDNLRDLQLREEGWVILRYTWDDVHSRWTKIETELIRRGVERITDHDLLLQRVVARNGLAPLQETNLVLAGTHYSLPYTYPEQRLAILLGLSDDQGRLATHSMNALVSNAEWRGVVVLRDEMLRDHAAVAERLQALGAPTRTDWESAGTTDPYELPF